VVVRRRRAAGRPGQRLAAPAHRRRLGRDDPPPLLRAARWLPLACLLFLPVLAGLHCCIRGPAMRRRWKPDTPSAAGGFILGFFILQRRLSAAVERAGLDRDARRRRSAGRAAACLLVWAFSVGLAAVDWIMSLQPEWYSSVFGWLAGAGQMLTGLALAVLLIDREAARAPAGPRQPADDVRDDLGLPGLRAVPDHLGRRPAARDRLVPAARHAMAGTRWPGACWPCTAAGPVASCCRAAPSARRA
jgi:hypothetical protein